MDNIKEKINLTFKYLFNYNLHPFFSDIEKVNKIAKNYINHQKIFISEKINYQKIKIPDKEEIKEIEQKVLSTSHLIKLNNEINNLTNFKKILKIVSEISKFFIKTNIKDKELFFEKISKDNKINICIIGAGPIGLFLACYLNLYYNLGKLNEYPKVNIVLFDNFINKPGFRKPYSRHRPFATSSPFLPLILPKIYSYEKNSDSLYLNIYVLEYLLLSKVILKHKIPLIFENYDWNEYKNIIEKANFEVVFDCTGGRLKTDIFNNIDSSWLDKMKKINYQLNKQLSINKEENLVHLIDHPVDRKFKDNNFYASLMVYDINLNFFNKFDIDIKNNDDLLFLNSIKKKYFNFKNLKKILRNIKDDIDRNFLYNILKKNNNFDDKLFFFDVWSIYIRHCIQPSEIFKVNGRKILYIGAGDTIFHSHFIIGAGLNRTIKFSIKCANLLTLLRT